MRSDRLAAAVFAFFAGALFMGASCAQAQPIGRLTLERVVLVTRHGVRPPTKAQPMREGIARDAWPSWPVPPGHLTPHGAEGIRRLAAFDRLDLGRRGLFAAGCPTASSVHVWADTDQRTIKTGEAFLEGFAPGCGLVSQHRPPGETDSLFSPFDKEGGKPLQGEAAAAAVLAALGPGGLQTKVAASADALNRLQRIYVCCSVEICRSYGIPAPCGLPDLPTSLAPPGGEKPKMDGALDLGSTAGQILLLEYVDGKPLSEVGWGRASKADIQAALALHALEYEIVARPAYISTRGAGPILRATSQALKDGPKLTVFVGHDTNIAHLAGALGLAWKVGDYPANDPPPGGALGFELLRDASGARYVRAVFRAQTMDQLRDLTRLDRRTPPARQVLTIPGCAVRGAPTLCPLPRFKKMVAALPVD